MPTPTPPIGEIAPVTNPFSETAAAHRPLPTRRLRPCVCNAASVYPGTLLSMRA